MQKRKPKNQSAKPQLAKEERQHRQSQLLKKQKVAVKPQSRNFKALSEEPELKQAENDASKIRTNRDQQQNGNRQKNDGRNGVENKVKATATIVALMTTKKQQGQSKRRNESRQQEDKRSNQKPPREDFKTRMQQP